MGDSRSWGADKERETRIAFCGNEVPYFDTCQCEACQKMREYYHWKKEQADSVRREFSSWMKEKDKDEIQRKQELIRNLLHD